MRKSVQTDVEAFDLTQIPLSAEIRLGRIFKEGESKYGKGNWRNGAENIAYQLERANHAIKHLKIYIHMLEHGEYIGELRDDAMPEDDLAKVTWFCVTQMELERLQTMQSTHKA